MAAWLSAHAWRDDRHVHAVLGNGDMRSLQTMTIARNGIASKHLMPDEIVRVRIVFALSSISLDTPETRPSSMRDRPDSEESFPPVRLIRPITADSAARGDETCPVGGHCSVSSIIRIRVPSQISFLRRLSGEREVERFYGPKCVELSYGGPSNGPRIVRLLAVVIVDFVAAGMLCRSTANQ